MSRPWVIKAGGELMSSEKTCRKILQHIGKWRKAHPIVFVHGGGPQIESELKERQIPTTFVQGRRVTSTEAMTVVEQVLSGSINKGLAAQLSAKKIPAVGLSCRDGNLIVARPLPGLGRAARPVKANVSLLTALLNNGFVPVVSSVGSDAAGASVNINADDAASALAVALKAQNLIFLTNISGVQDSQRKRLAVLKIRDIDALIAAGVITGGMIPKVQSARRAIQSGVGEVDIVNGHQGIDFDSGTRITS